MQVVEGVHGCYRVVYRNAILDSLVFKCGEDEGRGGGGGAGWIK